jgi:hypothetical protein
MEDFSFNLIKWGKVTEMMKTISNTAHKFTFTIKY